MTGLLFLIPIALFLGALGLIAFLWSIKSGQYDDLEGAAYRILDDDEEGPKDSEGAATRTPYRSADGPDPEGRQSH